MRSLRWAPGRRLSPQTTSSRELARRLGARAERLVAGYIVERGMTIVATNLRVGALEIDIVARQGPVVVVIEVRYRGHGAWTHPLGSMTREKRRRLRRAGERLWQHRYRHDETVDRLRFDAASVTFDSEGAATVEYVPAAF